MRRHQTKAIEVDSRLLSQESDPWICAKRGDVNRLEKIVKWDIRMLDAKDEHMNTPLYYACLCGQFGAVRWLCSMGAKDDQYARCYFNALNIQIRKYLKGFNVYSHLFGSSRSIKRAPSVQEIISSSFERFVVRTSQNLQDKLIEQSGEEQPTKQEPEPVKKATTTTTTDNDLDVEGGEEEEEHVESPNHDITIVLYDKRGRVVQEFPCHLFVLLTQGRESFIMKLLFNRPNDPTSITEVSDNELRSRLHELRRTKVIEIRDTRVNSVGLEIYLRYLYTGKLIIPWKQQIRHNAEDRAFLVAESEKQKVLNPKSTVSAASSSAQKLSEAEKKKQDAERKARYQAKFKGDLLFGNLFPDVVAHRKKRLRSFWNDASIVLVERFETRHLPLIDSLIYVCDYFGAYELLDIITHQLKYRQNMINWYSDQRKESDKAQPKRDGSGEEGTTVPKIKGIQLVLERLHEMKMARVNKNSTNDLKRILSALIPKRRVIPTKRQNRGKLSITWRPTTTLKKKDEKVPLKHIDYKAEWEKIDAIISHLKTVNMENLGDTVFVVKKNKHWNVVEDEVLRKVKVILRDACSVCVRIEDEVGCERIYGSKALLVWRSEFFKHALSGSFSDSYIFMESERELIESTNRDYNFAYEPPVFDLYDCSSVAGAHCIQYCFTDEELLTPETAIEALMLSTRMGPWKNLEDKAIEIVKENVTPDNACDILVVAEMLSLSNQVKKDCAHALKRKLHKLTNSLSSQTKALEQITNELTEKGLISFSVLNELW